MLRDGSMATLCAHMGLYDFPLLYEALRLPDQQDVVAVQALIERHLDAPMRSIMDPACGPGTWLAPLANGAVRVAGNDLSERMSKHAALRFADRDSEFTQGDMRDLHFVSAPFDVALEASGSVCHLSCCAELVRFLTALRNCVRPGGLIIINFFFECDWRPVVEPVVTHDSRPVPIPGGGEASIRYAHVDRDPARRVDRFRRTVDAKHVPDTPDRFEDEYELRMWSGAEVSAAVREVQGLALVEAVHLIDSVSVWRAGRNGTELPESLRDEHLVVMRRTENR